jgi:hypothetical protein
MTPARSNTPTLLGMLALLETLSLSATVRTALADALRRHGMHQFRAADRPAHRDDVDFS